MGRDLHHACCNISNHCTYPQSGNAETIGSPNLHPLRAWFPVCFCCFSRTLWTVDSHSKTHHRVSSPDQYERTVNQTLKCMMASYVKENHKKWDVYLPEFRFTLNSALQEIIGVTPAELHTGRKIQSPVDRILQADIAVCSDTLPMRLSSD